MMAPFISLLLVTRTARASEDPDSLDCRPMKEIYKNGQELCETMWGDSFVYEADEAKGYTMWFRGDNPNPDTSAGLFTDDHAELDVCHLEYNHKATPGPEPLAECIPWKDHGCCSPDTVKDAQTLKEMQGGPEYHWDRCGSLSAECERYFIEEACFYECEPAVGLFRKFPSGDLLHDRDGHEVFDPRCDPYSDVYDEAFAASNDCDHNSWQVHRMPIKASYCKAFYDACKDDLFCGHGNFFECAKVSPDADAEALITKNNREKYLQEEARLRDTAITVPDEGEEAITEDSSAHVLWLAALALHA